MEQINFLNVANITPSTFDNLATLVTQKMASNVSLEGQFPQSPSLDDLNHFGKDILKIGVLPLIYYSIFFCIFMLLCTILFFFLVGSYALIQFVQGTPAKCRQILAEKKLQKIAKKVNTIDLRIQIKDMEIKMNQMEMKVDGLEGKVDEKLIQERLDHQTEMLAWKAQAKKEKDDLEVEIPKLQDKIHDIEQRLKKNFVYSL